MEIDETVYKNEESVRKQLKVQKSAYKWLQQSDDEVMTKSLKSYEAILFDYDGYRDSVDEFEDFVNSQLEIVTDTDFVQTVQKIKYRKSQIEMGDDYCDRVNLHLPESLIHDIPLQRRVGEWISERVETIANSAYDSRLHRISVKKEVYEYIESGDDVEDPISDAIVTGESDMYDVEEAHTQIKQYTTDEWYNSDDVSIDDIEKFGSTISQKNYHGRVNAINTAFENDNPSFNSRNDIIEFVKKSFGIKTDATAESYVDELNIEEYCDDYYVIDLDQCMDLYSKDGRDGYDVYNIDQRDTIDGSAADVIHRIKDLLEYQQNTNHGHTQMRNNLITSLDELVKYIDDSQSNDRRKDEWIESMFLN